MNERNLNFLIFVILSLIVVGGIAGLAYGIPAYGRYQTLLEEKNQIQVNEIRIAQQTQLIQVEKQKAEIRVQNALGIAESQKIINGSLTDRYLQYLAIDSQKDRKSVV